MTRASVFTSLVGLGWLAALSAGCGSDASGGTPAKAGMSGGGSSASGSPPGGSGNMVAGSASGGTANGGTANGGSSGGTATGGSSGGRPAGWLYTEGSKLKLSDGKGSGSVWMGRGVNIDDLFFCGYNGTLWMPAPSTELKKVVEGLMTGWKPTFIRLSLSMASGPVTVSWLSEPDKYQKPMIDVVKAIGQHDGVYLLLALRSDASMIGQDMQDGDPEATGIPSDKNSTPDKAKFPSGTDAVYQALVDSFKDDKFVMFGLTNEPGGNKLSNDQIRGAMDHAVATIRAEEDKLGVPHHIVSVQGQGWTSDIGFYAAKPLTYDNVVYEIHGYPPPPKSYTYDNIPVIIGEYGSLDAGSAPAFHADVESKQIPNLAWDFDSYSNCAPDLLEVNLSSTDLKPSEWGKIVQAYLLAHAPK